MLEPLLKIMLANEPPAFWNNGEIVIYSCIKDRGNQGVYVLYNSTKRLCVDYDENGEYTENWYYLKGYIYYKDMINYLKEIRHIKERTKKLLLIKILDELQGG